MLHYNVQDRIMVSLTLMLVIATIVASIQTTLPATPYLKMIDVWLFVAMNMMVRITRPTVLHCQAPYTRL